MRICVCIDTHAPTHAPAHAPARSLLLPCSVLPLSIVLLLSALHRRPQAKSPGFARLRRRRATARQQDELASPPAPADDSYMFTSSRSHAPDAERCLMQCIRRGAPIWYTGMILWYVFANAIVSGVATLLGVDTTSLHLDHPAPWPSSELKQRDLSPARTYRSIIGKYRKVAERQLKLRG